MKTFTIGNVTIFYDGGLSEKLELLDRLGVNYTPSADEIAEDDNQTQSIDQVKSEYSNTITTLLTIENTVSPTNAQVIAAVKFLAKTVRLILRFLARHYI